MAHIHRTHNFFMGPIRQVFYVSRAKPAVTDWNVQQIVVLSSRNNSHHEVSGCLLYSGQHFAQTLEGSYEVLESLLGRLRDDKRHSEMRILLDTFVDKRRYAGWSMGYVRNPALTDELESITVATAQPDMKAIERLMDRASPGTAMVSV